jgi:hypothetical protein
VVFLAFTHESALEAIALAKVGGHHVWLGADALRGDEHAAHIANGAKLTRFSHAFDSTDAEAVEEAVATIREHHPTETLWIQRNEGK